MEKIVEKLVCHPIFKNCSRELLLNALNESGGAAEIKYAKGEIICSPDKNDRRLYVILKGGAQVTKEKNGRRVIMSALSKGDVFGAASLYCERDYFMTTVTADEKCKALSLSREFTDYIFKHDISVAEDYISFLSDRIYFLNERIDAFTGGTAEQRLAAFICSSVKNSENENTVTLGQSITQLTETLDVGRASLYRAFDELTDVGAIRRDGKNITILNFDKLSEYNRI